MTKNDIANSAKTAETGISGAAGVGDNSVALVRPAWSLIPAPLVIPVLIARNVVGAVSRWLGRD